MNFLSTSGNNNYYNYRLSQPIPVAAPSKASVCGCVVAGIAGSNPSEDIDKCPSFLYVVLSCVGRGLCDGIITRQTSPAVCLIECD
jgi:hypothetical protein